MPDEPRTTAIVLVTVGVLVALSALTSRFSGRLGVPLALVFLVIGMAAGAEGYGLQFNDYELTFQLGTLALVLILFDGGLNTPRKVVRQGIKPASMLATVGVVATATLMALCAWALGLDAKHAALLGAIVSSTDAAAVFSVLRSSGIQLRRRVGVTLEMESGINDPMAVILTVACTRFLVTGDEPTPWLALEVLSELAIGAALGVAIGFSARALIKKARLAAGGLYPVLTIAIALLAYAIPTLLHGSGFLAVYLAAVMIGDSDLPYRAGILRVHDATAWVAQVGMFLVLGLVVSPHRLLDVAWLGLILGLAMALIARPIAVVLSLVWFRYPARELAYISWVGLRGAVPIILAIFPVMAGAKGASEIFHLVFFIVVVNAIIPGTTIRWVTGKLGLLSGEPPPPPAVLEINAMQHIEGRVLAFFVDKASAVSGVPIRDLPFPPGTAVMVIVRAGALVAPRGDVTLSNGDHLYVIAEPKDEPLVRLLFGQEADV